MDYEASTSGSCAVAEPVGNARDILAAARPADLVEFVEMHLDLDDDGKPIKLTPKEFDLLAVLARNAERIVTHRQILSTVWGPAHTEDLQYLRVFIGQLRQKLKGDADNSELIRTEPGIGYRLVPLKC